MHFNVYIILIAQVPADNPAAMEVILQHLTTCHVSNNMSKN